MFNEVAHIAQFDMVNSRTFKDLWNEIQGLSSTCPVSKYFQGLEFSRKKFKYFQGLSRLRGNPVHYNLYQTHINFFLLVGKCPSAVAHSDHAYLWARE